VTRRTDAQRIPKAPVDLGWQERAEYQERNLQPEGDWNRPIPFRTLIRHIMHLHKQGWPDRRIADQFNHYPHPEIETPPGKLHVTAQHIRQAREAYMDGRLVPE
jgi:hypothetical protein